MGIYEREDLRDIFFHSSDDFFDGGFAAEAVANWSYWQVGV